MDDFKLLNRKEIYKGRIFSLVQDTVILPNGKEGTMDTILHNGAAAIVPVDEDGNILFVKQYRNTAQRIALEIPAGRLEKGEDPLKCAKRELEEETSFKSDNFTHLIDMYCAIGYSNEIIYIYIATNLQQGEFNFDDDEFINVIKLSLDDALTLVKQGKIMDSKTITALYAYKDYLSNN